MSASPPPPQAQCGVDGVDDVRHQEAEQEVPVKVALLRYGARHDGGGGALCVSKYRIDLPPICLCVLYLTARIEIQNPQKEFQSNQSVCNQ